jgi:hypothetical protein
MMDQEINAMHFDESRFETAAKATNDMLRQVEAASRPASLP